MTRLSDAITTCCSLILFSLTIYTSHAENFMSPSLGHAFPMKVEGESILLEQSILFNKQTILPAGTVLRCCFQMPEKDSADLRKKQQKDKIENTFSRKPIKVSNQAEGYDPYREAVKDRAFATIWKNPDLFRGYFHKIEPSRYYLVYQLPSSASPAFSQFFFREGLFLSAKNEKIQVLAVQEGSRGAESGFTAGDQIHALEGLEFGGDLKLFLTHYLSVLQKNKLSGKPLTFSVLAAGETELSDREITLPLSIHSDPFGPIN